MTASIQDVLEGRSRWCVVCADNEKISLPECDHVITDAPYDEKTHAGARTGSGEAEGVSFASLTDPAALAKRLLVLSRRWVVNFCAFEMLGDFARGAGGSWIRSGVWDKVNPSPQLTGDRPAQAAEAVAIMHGEGRKRWNRGGGAAIWRHAPDRGAERPDHPTPKPVSLMLEIVADFTDPDEVILDPFAGSGATGVAALRLGRRVVMIEKDAKYAAVARERMTAEENGLSPRDARLGQRGLFEVER